MTIELYCLVVLTIFFCIAWLPASLAKRKTYGRSYLLSNRDTKDLPALPDWAERSHRAYENLKCYFPGFIVAILVLAHLQVSTPGTQVAAIVFTASRLGHFAAYTMGHVLLRALFWGIALVANLFLLITALTY